MELLEGVIVAMPPQNDRHAWPVEWLNQLLVRVLGKEYRVRPRLPLTLGDRNEPEPDLAVVAGPPTRGRHPGAALLVIEVADDSLRRDREVKAALYARFGIREYWIVNLEAEAVEVMTDPDPKGATYRRRRTVTKEEALSCAVLPQVSFAVREIFD